MTYSINIKGRSEIIYREGELAVFIEAEALANNYGFVIYKSSIGRNVYPAKVTLSTHEIDKIINRIEEEFKKNNIHVYFE